jgi:CheY-like chemotaxis protein
MTQTEPLRILVVEDHHDSCLALSRLLQRCGHEPHCFDRMGPALTAVTTGGSTSPSATSAFPTATGAT